MTFPVKSEPLFDLSAINLEQLKGPFFPGENTPVKEGEKFVVFHLSGQQFAVNSRLVAEVTRYLPLTPLPDAPAWLIGVANLRGDVISVVNLARIFRLKSPAVSSKTKLIVLKPQSNLASVAFVIDRLSEIVTIAPNEIVPADDHRLIGCTNFTLGTISLLDADQIFSSLL